MALTYSEMIPTGKNIPPFSLRGIDGKLYSRDDFSDSKILVTLFISVHCPYVKAVEERITELQNYFLSKSVQFIAICSNDSERYPEDAPAGMREQAHKNGWKFPYLIDDHQEMAKSFGAVCTPDIFVFNEERRLAYRGRIDDNWKEPAKVTKEELKKAINDLLDGQTLDPKKQLPSMGCSIKWKSS
jgi:peroxiredoxin